MIYFSLGTYLYSICILFRCLIETERAQRLMFQISLQKVRHYNIRLPLQSIQFKLLLGEQKIIKLELPILAHTGGSNTH